MDVKKRSSVNHRFLLKKCYKRWMQSDQQQCCLLSLDMDYINKMKSNLGKERSWMHQGRSHSPNSFGPQRTTSATNISVHS